MKPTLSGHFNRFCRGTKKGSQSHGFDFVQSCRRGDFDDLLKSQEPWINYLAATLLGTTVQKTVSQSHGSNSIVIGSQTRLVRVFFHTQEPWIYHSLATLLGTAVKQKSANQMSATQCFWPCGRGEDSVSARRVGQSLFFFPHARTFNPSPSGHFIRYPAQARRTQGNVG